MGVCDISCTLKNISPDCTVRDTGRSAAEKQNDSSRISNFLKHCALATQRALKRALILQRPHFMTVTHKSCVILNSGAL